ncbi:LytTR family transcriptional regulator [Caulobacter segnis]|uniref:Response regulator receiver protein n=2 Tax=Caulobacter segnis TaxID=88688 RepID=D5VP57_CAUST|nr:LytTR family DNA-binding domain-containing protein [Caulobacter segnis]ADG12280.1 response regulator receiver protein [Caulobacter segnis ATCC 21756]AVQ03876.1 LytTR family transcriptional regulator [Caulobacter segnis]
MLAFTAYSWAATTLCAAWFARRFAANQDRDLSVLDSLVWQGAIYAVWLPAAAIVWLLLRRYGSGAIGHLALYLTGALIVPLESLTSALIDNAFASGSATIAARTLARLPISLLLYTAIVAIGLAAAHHRRAHNERARAHALEIALDQARQALARAVPSPLEERLIVMSGARRVPVEIADVEWFGAADNYVVVHWSDREGLLRSTLQALEERLDPKLFARCHRSALVNLARVRAFAPLSDGSWRLTMESGAEVVTSRTYRRELLERLGL